MNPILKTGAALALGLLAALPAQAREFGTPPAMPSGTTMGTPVGANFPQPGFYLTNRNAFVQGEVFDGDGNATGQTLDILATGAQVHWVPGFELWGGTYRAMAVIGYQDLSFGAGGTTLGENTSFTDLVVSPLNVHWMTSPGVFVNAGVSLSLPTGDFGTSDPTIPNGGQNAPVLGFDAGVSYLRDGWNLTAHANYFIHGENEDTSYRSGDEFLLNWTAMKAVGDQSWSVGAVGYLRTQVTDDRNNGAFYGGTTADRLREAGIGLSVAKQMGPAYIQADYTWNVAAENTLGADQLRISLTVPIGGAGG